MGDIAAWNTGGGGFGHGAYVYAVSGGVASLAGYNHAGTGAFTSNRTVSNGSSGAPSEWVHIGPPPSGGSRVVAFNGAGSGDLTTCTFNGSGACGGYNEGLGIAAGTSPSST